MYMNSDQGIAKPSLHYKSAVIFEYFVIAMTCLMVRRYIQTFKYASTHSLTSMFVLRLEDVGILYDTNFVQRGQFQTNLYFGKTICFGQNF